jgi:hypothetical protein
MPVATPLEIEQRITAVHAVTAWISIKHEQGQGVTEADAAHSSLLDWLLAGNEPLPNPPPVLYSRPNHRLALGEPCKLMDPPADFLGGKVLIAGNSQWKWFSKKDGTLKHLPSGDIYHWDEETNVIRKV